MATSIVSCIIFLLLFTLSLFVDGNVFAAQMEHGKLGAAKEIMTMRNLEETGRKIAAERSTSHHSGQKSTEKEPSKTQPDQAKTQGQKDYLSYPAISGKGAVDRNPYAKCNSFRRCKRGTSN